MEIEIEKSINNLPEECRHVFQMSRFDHKKYEDIAQELNISVNTVKYHIKNALAKYDDLWLPYYLRINDWIHANTQWKTFKHSCGAVENFMGRFIDSGFDIINPVQVSAKGMNPSGLKEKYGNHLTFGGGGIDTQKTLPYGTVEDIRNEVLRHCDIFAKDGGFVFNTVHNIQGNVPVENNVAMINALKEFDQ